MNETQQAHADLAFMKALVQEGEEILEQERARYEAELAERRYRLVEPENRLVAAELELR